jgi:hypothetical protein
VLLIDVLTGLGGASQERSAARNFLIRFNEEARKTAMSTALLHWSKIVLEQIGPIDLGLATSPDPFGVSVHQCSAATYLRRQKTPPAPSAARVDE